MSEVLIAIPFLFAGGIFFLGLYQYEQRKKKKSNKDIDIDEYDY